MTRAVVFAYHNVGVRCLSVLLAQDVEVPLVITHEDHPGETIWFESVAALARLHDIDVATPEDPNEPRFVARVARLAPDFLFSFYYRSMLKAPLLATPARGAYNMHGSLLPGYRGRAPVNWAVLHGERQTGATLHRMVEKPDAGDIVAQQAVPILPDDTAFEVFQKVTVAAEIALDAVLPALLDGSAVGRPQDLSRGAYFSGRKPEDGRIDWRAPASVIHDLVRAVAPPYPGAFCTQIAADGRSGILRILKTIRVPAAQSRSSIPGMYVDNGAIYADCADGQVLRLLVVEFDGQRLGPNDFPARFGVGKVHFL